MVKNITQLNFEKMKKMGMDRIIFNKLNTLCRLNKTQFISFEVRDAFDRAVNTFGEENILIV